MINDPPPVESAAPRARELTGLWFVGFDLTNAPKEEVVGIVLTPDDRVPDQRTTGNAMSSDDLLLHKMKSDRIVGSFRSYREMRLLECAFDTEHARIEWVRASREGDAWRFVHQAPPSRPLTERERWSLNPIGESDSGIGMYSVLTLLPPPLDDRGVGVITNHPKANSLVAIWPADLSCGWVLDWWGATRRAESGKIKEVISWKTGERGVYDSDLRMTPSK